MSPHEAQMLARLQAMKLPEARLALARKEFGDPPDSPNYLFASGVLAAMEAAERDAREETTLSIAKSALEIAASERDNSRRANSIATIAMICATIATISAAIIGAIFGAFIKN